MDRIYNLPSLTVDQVMVQFFDGVDWGHQLLMRMPFPETAGGYAFYVGGVEGDRGTWKSLSFSEERDAIDMGPVRVDGKSYWIPNPFPAK